jgi:hypothetical protein
MILVLPILSAITAAAVAQLLLVGEEEIVTGGMDRKVLKWRRHDR